MTDRKDQDAEDAHDTDDCVGSGDDDRRGAPGDDASPDPDGYKARPPSGRAAK